MRPARSADRRNRNLPLAVVLSPLSASALIVAAGASRRLGLGRPKAFIPLGGRPLLLYTLDAIARAAIFREVVIAVPAGMEDEAQELATRSGAQIAVKVVAGGRERQDSVRLALALVSAESEIVAVHDAARPMADAALFRACVEAAARNGGAVAAILAADTLKRVDSGKIVGTVNRERLYAAQTPQAFRCALLREAHERAVRDGLRATDDAQLLEMMGRKLDVVEGSALNFKITNRSDLELAEALVARLPLG